MRGEGIDKNKAAEEQKRKDAERVLAQLGADKERQERRDKEAEKQKRKSQVTHTYPKSQRP